jgi:hypothetical protein
MPYKDIQEQKKFNKNYYLKNKDKIIARSKLRYENNKNDIKEYCKKRYQRIRHLIITGEGKGHGKGRKFTKGFTPWNKGLKGKQTAWNKGKGEFRTKEGIESFKNKMRGRTAHNKGIHSLLNGDKNPNWKGGITPINEKIRKSLEYKLWQDAVFARDGYTCQKYGIKGGNLNTHHILNFSQYPELRFAIDNGITLSEKAHREFHKIYGVRNNTREQLEEFLTRIV